jgi:hypothetical protein
MRDSLGSTLEMTATRPTTTRAIQAFRALNHQPDARWVDWAVRLLTEGADTPALRILAGLVPPLDYFEATKLLDRALQELAIPPLDAKTATDAYAADLVEGLLHAPHDMEQHLKELFQLCVDAGNEPTLMKFYLLYCAYNDLKVQDVQFYWEGADRSNIDRIVRDEAQRWLERHGRAA